MEPDRVGKRPPGGGRPAPKPTRPPGADGGGAARHARRLHPPTRPQTGREGGGGGGTEPSAIFPYSPKHTDTLSGHRLHTQHGPTGPRARPARAGGGGTGKPQPGRQPPRQEARTHAHPPRPPPLTHIQLLAPGKSVAPVQLATHRTTQTSSRNQGTRRREAPGDGGAGSRDETYPGCIPGPGVTGNKVYRKAAAAGLGAAGVSTKRLHSGAGTRSSPRPPPPPPPWPATALFPFSPQAGALAELRRAPGGAFLLRHLLLLLLLQRRLHLPLVAASVPAPGPVALK